jgi:hypothetical protein
LLGARPFEVTARSHFLQVKFAFERVKDNIVNIAGPVQTKQFRSSSGDRGEHHGEVLLLSSNQLALGFAEPRGRARPIAVLLNQPRMTFEYGREHLLLAKCQPPTA